jgi:hypothetical protein
MTLSESEDGLPADDPHANSLQNVNILVKDSSCLADLPAGLAARGYASGWPRMILKIVSDPLAEWHFIVTTRAT